MKANTKTKMMCMVMAMLLILASFTGCAKDGTDTTETTTAATNEAIETTEGARLADSGKETTASTQATETKGADAAETTEASAAAVQTGSSSNSTPATTQPAHTHSYTKGATVAATCTSDGYTTYTCSCGDSYNSDWTSATGHSWGEWVVTVEATTSAEGQETRTCYACGATESQSTPKIEVTLDYAAVAAYGNSYAADAYGYGYNAAAVSYFPGYSVSVEYVLNDGGMDFLYMRMAEVVDSLKCERDHLGYTYPANVCCYCWESDGMIYLQVNYG